MSVRLRQCRQGLAKALDQAMNHLPEDNHNSVTISRPGTGPNPSCPLHTHHPEMIPDLCLALMDHNPVLTRQESRHWRTLEDFTISRPELEHRELPANTDSPALNILDELLAKLEFENELNRVCNTGARTGHVDSSGAASEEENEKDKRLMDMVLDMEQDYNLFVF